MSLLPCARPPAWRTLLGVCHTCAERFHAAHKEPGILDPKHRAQTILQPLQLISQLLGSSYRETCQHIAMPAKEFGRAMDDDIHAELNRTLVKRRHERIIQQGKQAMLLRPIRHRTNVGNFQGRVRRGFHIDGFRIRFEGGLHLIQIGHVHEGALDAHTA